MHRHLPNEPEPAQPSVRDIDKTQAEGNPPHAKFYNKKVYYYLAAIIFSIFRKRSQRGKRQ